MAEGKKPYFPMYVDLSEKKVYIVGAGTIAKRRVRSLCAFSDHVTVVAPEVNPELNKMEKNGRIRILRKKCENKDIVDGDIVIAASNDRSLNEEIYDFCKKKNILVNVCNDKTRCDFYFPGLIMDDEVVIGVVANGHSHKKARFVIEKIKEILEWRG